MSNGTLFHNATVYAKDGPHQAGWVQVEQGRIAAIGWGTLPNTDVERIDAEGHVLAPGFIDIHVHGAVGHDTMDATPEALRDMASFYAQHGVTSFLATTMSNSAQSIMAALQNIAIVMRTGTSGAELLGAHIEGPYLNVERPGAMDVAQIRRADPAEYRRFFETGVVRLITLAPEFPENLDLARFALAHGAQVALGHTCASYDDMCRAVEMGVNQVTHMFNGMVPLHHRTPGAVGAGLTLDALYCQIIADNVHVHPTVLSLAVKAKGLDRIVLITDAIGGAGMPDGEYGLGGLPVTVRDGVARIASGALAGSTLTMERAVRNIMAAANLSLFQALPLATSNPARSLGLENKGEIAVGMDADLIVLDEQVNVLLTMVKGEIIYRR